MYNQNNAYEISSDGLQIEDGVLIISGSIDPSSITMIVPAIYFRTNGEIWKTQGSGWTQLISATAFDDNLILLDNEFNQLMDNELNLLSGV